MKKKLRTRKLKQDKSEKSRPETSKDYHPAHETTATATAASRNELIYETSKPITIKIMAKMEKREVEKPLQMRSKTVAQNSITQQSVHIFSHSINSK